MGNCSQPTKAQNMKAQNMKPPPISIPQLNRDYSRKHYSSNHKEPTYVNSPRSQPRPIPIQYSSTQPNSILYTIDKLLPMMILPMGLCSVQ